MTVEAETPFMKMSGRSPLEIIKLIFSSAPSPGTSTTSNRTPEISWTSLTTFISAMGIAVADLVQSTFIVSSSPSETSG